MRESFPRFFCLDGGGGLSCDEMMPYDGDWSLCWSTIVDTDFLAFFSLCKILSDKTTQLDTKLNSEVMNDIEVRIRIMFI